MLYLPTLYISNFIYFAIRNFIYGHTSYTYNADFSNSEIG